MLNEKQQAVLNAVAEHNSVSDIAEVTGLAVPSVRGYILGLVKAHLVTNKDGVVSLVKEEKVADITYVAKTNTRGRKSDPTSVRQKAHQLIRELLMSKTKRADILVQLHDQFQLGDKHGGTYIQQVRKELGLVGS
jgi:hypothetical protein